MPTCSSCNRKFQTQFGLETHQTVKSHCHCPTCDRFFVNEQALNEHGIAYHDSISVRYTCQHCQQSFISNELCKKHQKSMQHCYCFGCDRFFKTGHALDQHMKDSPRHNVFWAFQCNDCPRTFETQQGLDHHHRQMKHIPKPAPSSPTSLLAQLVQANIRCPGGQCDRHFVSLSAALRHLESGACPSGINMDKILAFIQRMDTDRVITSSDLNYSSIVPERIKDSETISSLDEDALSTPSTNGGVLLDQLSLSMAHLDLSDNTCTACAKSFSGPKDLKNHMKSPVHLPKLFHCDLPPTTRGFKTFRTLSDLLRHIESGACKNGRESLHRGLAYVESNLLEIRTALVNIWDRRDYLKSVRKLGVTLGKQGSDTVWAVPERNKVSESLWTIIHMVRFAWLSDSWIRDL